MWILKFLPDWIFFAILVFGTVGLLLTRFIPAMYRSTAYACSMAAFVVGVFMAGAIHDNNSWLARVEEMEEKVAKAEEQAIKETEKIEVKVEKEKIRIQEKQVVVKEYIDREVVKYDNQCIIPKEFIEVHNKAAVK
jgi:uncharacterized protein YacL (UPF0231 family)